MPNESRNDISRVETTNAGARPEQTRPGPICTPAVDIFENEAAITILADMPGVAAKDLTIDLRENVLTLTGRVTSPEAASETEVLREYQPGTFWRQFSLGETIEQSQIDAKLADGVLRLQLPKQERSRPRQIAVRTD